MVYLAFQGWYVDVAKAYPGIDAIPWTCMLLISFENVF